MNKVFKRACVRFSLYLIERLPVLAELAKRSASRYLDLYNNFSYDPFLNGEINLLKAVASQNQRRKNIIFDVGANIGNWSYQAEKYFPNSDLHLFELHPATCNNLKLRFKQKSSFKINNIALTSGVAEVQYKSFGENDGSNTLVLNSDFKARSFEVLKTKGLSGDQYCADHDIDTIELLKIDVEGYEMSVIKGFTEAFLTKRVRIVQFEYGYANGDAQDLMRDFFKFFQKMGYRVGVLRQSGVKFSEFKYAYNNFNSGPNFVACLPEHVRLLERF